MSRSTDKHLPRLPSDMLAVSTQLPTEQSDRQAKAYSRSTGKNLPWLSRRLAGGRTVVRVSIYRGYRTICRQAKESRNTGKRLPCLP